MTLFRIAVVSFFFFFQAEDGIRDYKVTGVQTCYLIRPFGLNTTLDAAVGVVLGTAIVIFEWRLIRVSLKRLIGAAIGSILGIFGAYLFALVIKNSLQDGATRNFLQLMVMLLM